LVGNTVRLLSLDKSKSRTVSGILKTVSLSDVPHYFCLSYTWGTQSEDVEIHIDGQVLYVTPSLVEMLQRLQDLKTEGSIPDLELEWIWIDRLCINQEDINERSEQVRCMGKIYSQAIRTIVWVGPDLKQCSSAWRLIEQIYCICMSENPQAKYLADIPLRIYSDQNHTDSGLPPWTDELWEHLRGLFTLPWFTRTWIIQEVALSSKDPIILHGQHRYSWERLGWAASWLRRNGYLRLRHIPDQLQNCDTISNIRRSRNPWQLDALLTTTAVKFKATNQRDKIYGLLGLAAEFQNTESIPTALLPDYKLDVWELYTKVVLHFLREHRRLPTLARASGVWGDSTRAQYTNQYKLLPSWVPNWSDHYVSNSEHTKGLHWLYYSNNGEAARLGFPMHSDASAGLPATILESHHESVLRLGGLVADTVVSVVPYNETSQTTEQESISKAWRIFVRSLSERGATECIKAFINTSTAEQHCLSGRSAEQIQKDGSAYLLEILTTNTVSEIDDEGIIGELTAISIGGDPASYASLTKNLCHNRSLVVTSNGCIGISPLDTQAEDNVAIVFGGGVPYIIRKYDDAFLFVGDSYIHGLMNGEAVQKLREGQLREEVLEFH
jgi:hypothetical protein